jgi:hypothetical protein
LGQAELIFRRGTPPDAEYTFKHALVQNAAYDTLLRSRRQQIHARIAATLLTAVLLRLLEEPTPLPTPNWAQPLPRPVIIPEVMELGTLADVRALIEKHLPAERRTKFTWRQLAGMLRRAAEGKEDVAEVSTAFQIVFKIEGVEYRQASFIVRDGIGPTP